MEKNTKKNMNVPEIIFSSEKKKPLKIGGSEYFSANDFSLTEKEIEKARIELFETEEKKIRKLHELRNLLANDKDVSYRTDTSYLLRFLRIRKYDTIKAYQNIKEGYMFKKNHPEILQIPDNLTDLLNLNLCRYLPYTTEEGLVLLYNKIEKWNLPETSVEEALQVLSAVASIISMNPRMQVNGIIAVWNAKGFTAHHIAAMLKNFGPRGFSFYMQNMFPWRMKKLLVINTGPLSRLFFKLVRPFLSKKISQRVLLLGYGIEELHKYINPVLLPKELGGFLDENQCSVVQNIMDNIPYLKYEMSFTGNE